MPIQLLAGDDDYGISCHLAKLKQPLLQQWLMFNYFRYDASDLQEALAIARTPPLGDRSKVVVVDNLSFKEADHVAQLTAFEPSSIPPVNMLVLVCHHVDKRLKVFKHLTTKPNKYIEFNQQSEWRLDLIESDLRSLAREMQLSLPNEQFQYLAEAIGIDKMRTASELEKLQLYADGDRLTDDEVQALVPSLTQNSLKVATALRQGKGGEAALLAHQMVLRGENPLRILGTLITQFRTWLWVKLCLEKGTYKDWEIAKLCNLSNPRRMYYLKPEVERLNTFSLAAMLIALVELDAALKQGKRSLFIPTLVYLSQKLSNTNTYDYN
jgi:DNA polymerase-3 subunit delta